MIELERYKFLLDRLGTFWEQLPPQQQVEILNIWRGYGQSAAKLYALLYQYDYSKSLQDIQTTIDKLWKKYTLFHYFDLKSEPPFTQEGNSATNLDYNNEEERLDCSFYLKGGYDRLSTSLVSEIDNFANLYWQVGFSTDTNSGGLVGYFNSDSDDLTNSISIGWSEGSLLAEICDIYGNLHMEESPNFLAPNTPYTLTAKYIASGGELNVDCLDSSDNLIHTLRLFVPPEEFPIEAISTVSQIASAASGINFTCDLFGITNINFKNKKDFFNSVSDNGESKVFDFGYMDPSIDKKIQSIPILQSELEYPLIELQENEDFYIINSELYLKDFLLTPYLWGHHNLYDNDAVSDNFGHPVNYELAEDVHVDSIYLNGIKGLWHSYLFGPTISNLETGLTILGMQPYVIKAGKVTYIDTYSDTQDVIYIEPDDGSETLAYFYNSSIGLAINNATGERIKVGDHISRFHILTSGIKVVDLLNDNNWHTYHLPYIDGIDYSIQKYKSFGIKLKKLELNAFSLQLMICNFINYIKPSDSRAWFLKTDDSPLFMFGDYSHYPYVDVDIIGNQNIYLPADFYYVNHKEKFYYSTYKTYKTASGHDYIPILSSDPLVNVTDSQTFLSTYENEYDFYAVGSSLAEGSLIFIYGKAGYYSNDSGKSWSLVSNKDSTSAQEFVLGNHINAVNVFYLQNGERINFISTFGLERQEGTSQGKLKVGTILDNKMYHEVSYFDQDIDLHVNGDISPLCTCLRDSVTQNEDTFFTSGLLMGVSDSNKEKFQVYEIENSGYTYTELTQDTSEFNMEFGDHDSTGSIVESFTLDRESFYGLETTIKLSKMGSPSDNVYIDLYEEHYTGGVFNNTKVATSEKISSSTIGLEVSQIKFTISDSLPAGNYCIRIRRSGGVDPNNYYVLRTGRPQLSTSSAYPEPISLNYLSYNTFLNAYHKSAYAQTIELYRDTEDFSINIKAYRDNVDYGDQVITCEIRDVGSHDVILTANETYSVMDLSTDAGNPTDLILTFEGLLEAENEGTEYFVWVGFSFVYVPRSLYILADSSFGRYPGYTYGLEDSGGWSELPEKSLSFNLQCANGLVTDENIWYNIVAPLIYPDDYFIISNKSKFPISDTELSYSRLGDVIKNNINLFYLGDSVWKFFVATKYKNYIYCFTSTDDGVNWEEKRFRVHNEYKYVVCDTFFFDSQGNLYYYYKNKSDNTDNVIMTPNEGQDWSSEIELSWSVELELIGEEDIGLSSKIYPDFVEDSEGTIWLVGVDENSAIVTFKLQAQG